MLHIFRIENGVLREKDTESILPTLADDASWIDLVDSEDSERELVQQFLEAELPASDDMEEIEASARFFSDEQGLHVHSLFLFQSEGRARTSTVAFVVQEGRLLSFRDSRLPDFRLLRLRVRRDWVKTQQPMIGGVLATAGGLLFTGEGNGLFKAYDAETGSVLWKFQAGAGVNAPPSSYTVDGKQWWPSD